MPVKSYREKNNIKPFRPGGQLISKSYLWRADRNEEVIKIFNMLDFFPNSLLRDFFK